MKDKNKNRKGYKETKVGWIPEEWKNIHLEDVADPEVRWSITGGPFGSDLQSSSYTTAGVRIIQLQNIGDGFFKDNSKIFTSLEKANELVSCNIYPGDIILSKMGDPVARACIIPKLENRYLMCSDGIRLSVDKEHYDTFFIFSVINAKTFRNNAYRAGTGSTRRRIGLSTLKKITLNTPPLPEQKSIASVLECWDKAIQKYEEKIEKKKNIKKGLMQKLLSGEQSLPGFDGEWEETRLGMIGKIISGGTPSTSNSEYWTGSIPWCTPSEVVALNGKNISATKRCITPKGLKESSANLLSPNSLIVCTRATIGNCVINTVPMATNQGFKSIDAYVNADIDFLYYSIGSKKKVLLRLGSGSTFLEVSTGDFRKIKISLPPLPEQKAIASVLSSADSEIKALEKKLALLRDQKKYLLNNLVTGTIRLPEFCKEVG